MYGEALRQGTKDVVLALRRPRGVAMATGLLLVMLIELLVISREELGPAILNLVAVGFVGILAMQSQVSSRRMVEEQGRKISELNESAIAVRSKLRREGEIIRTGVLSLARYRIVPGSFYTAGTFDVELDLPSILAPHLQSQRAIDVGANRGDFTAALRRAGMSVDAFEPLPDLARELQARFAQDPKVRIHATACGNVDGEASLHLAQSVDRSEDATIFATLSVHETFPGVAFESSIPVRIRRLDSFFGATDEFGILKIDTEGHDLDVLEGSNVKAETVLVEFWDEAYLFNRGRTSNTLADYLKWFAHTRFQHHVVFWRDDATQDFGVILDAVATPSQSWGNILFVQDHDLLGVVAKWTAERFGRSRVVAGSGNG